MRSPVVNLRIHHFDAAAGDARLTLQSAFTLFEVPETVLALDAPGDVPGSLAADTAAAEEQLLFQHLRLRTV